MNALLPAASALMVAILFATPQARAGQVGGSSDSFILGNEAAIVGGAGMAITSDGGAAWANPAGLAAVPGSSLSLSASAFMLRLRRASNVFSTTIRDKFGKPETFSSDLDSTELITVPSSIVKVWRLSEGLGLALGLFTPRSDVFHVRQTVDASQGNLKVGPYITYSDAIEVTRRQTRTQVGPSLGWSPLPWLRVGASLHLIYDQNSETRTLQHMDSTGVHGDPAYAVLEAVNDHYSFTTWASRATLGLQLTLPWDVRAGLVIRSPVIQLSREALLTSVRSYLVIDEDFSEVDFESWDDPQEAEPFLVLEPTRVFGGLSFPLGSGWVALDGDFRPSHTGPHRDRASPSIWNVRAGARFKLDKRWRVGAGLFTDHSRKGGLGDHMTARVDYYGATAGVQLLTRFQLADKEASHRIAMLTTVGLRWAVGVGELRTEHIFPEASDDEAFFREDSRDVIWHEASLHLGTGILF